MILMDNNYIKNGYILCKDIGDIVNCKQNNATACNTVDDLKNRISFLQSHNLITFFDFVIDKEQVISYFGTENYNVLCENVKQKIFRQFKNDLMSDNISHQLQKNDVENIILKGSSYKKFYPENIVRTSTDIDIYVNQKDITKAGEVLNDNGFTFVKVYKNKEYSYKKEPRYYIELHTDMDGFNKTQKSLLNSLTDGCSRRNTLTDNDSYIYALFHLYKHFVTSGAGVRMFLDIYLIKKNSKLNFEYINKKLKALDIYDFANVVTKINESLFEGKEADDDLKAVIAFIFDSGTFGKVSSDLHLKQINKKAKHTNKIEEFVVDNCLDFNSMKKRYPILKKCPLLYPFSFIHRFFYGITHKRNVLKEAQETKNSISKDKVDQYEKIFNTLKINVYNK